MTKVWQKMGSPEIGEVFENWYALAEDVEIKFEYSGTEDEYPFVSNTAEINRKCKKLERKLDQLLDELEFTADDIPAIVCDVFNLDFRPEHKFREYWVDRILASPGFASYAPVMSKDGRPNPRLLCDWVTARHVVALKSHGYQYKFAFWGEPKGDMRGDLWIQTDQGPLILTDMTDSESLQTNFPVQVSNLARRKQFKLVERDLKGGTHRKSFFSRLLGRKKT